MRDYLISVLTILLLGLVTTEPQISLRFRATNGSPDCWTKRPASSKTFQGISNTAFAQKDPQQEAILELVRTLGYGGAIHHFKNFLLRGTEEDQLAAEKLFQKAQELLARLRQAPDLTNDEKAAVAILAKALKQYQSHLPTVKKLHQAGKSPEEVDAAIAMDDTPGFEALLALRQGRTWSPIEELELHIGCEGGIGNFKNFVLRADEKYRARAALGLTQTLLVVSQARSLAEVTARQRKALDRIEGVVRAYEDALPQVQEFVGQGKTAQQIDRLIKVNDAPALEGLKMLRR